MYEFAFIVKHDSQIYCDYFTAKAEEERAREKAEAFFAKYFEKGPRKYQLSKLLTCTLSEEEYETYHSQLKQNSLGRNLRTFLARSTLNKAWQREVYSYISEEKLNANRFWWAKVDVQAKMSGRIFYSLWDNGEGELYGYISCQSMDKPGYGLPSMLKQIKLSEYYAEAERLAEKDSKAGEVGE